MLVLYGIFWIWRGSRFRPPDAETAEEQYERGAFFRTFRTQGRGFAISQRRLRAEQKATERYVAATERNFARADAAQARRDERNRKIAERELKKRDLL
jgi:hypothetical protein